MKELLKALYRPFSAFIILTLLLFSVCYAALIFIDSNFVDDRYDRPVSYAIAKAIERGDIKLTGTACEFMGHKIPYQDCLSPFLFRVSANNIIKANCKKKKGCFSSERIERNSFYQMAYFGKREDAIWVHEQLKNDPTLLRIIKNPCHYFESDATKNDGTFEHWLNFKCGSPLWHSGRKLRIYFVSTNNKLAEFKVISLGE